MAGQAPQFPQRCRGQIGQLDLVHRSRLRHRQDLEGERAAQEIDGCHVYRSIRRAARSNGLSTTWCGRTVWRFRRTRSFLYVADTGATHKENGPRHIRRFAVSKDGKSVKGGEIVRRMYRRPLRRIPRSIGTGASGRAPTRASIVSIATGRSSARSSFPRSSLTSLSAGSSATVFSSAARHRSTPSS